MVNEIHNISFQSGLKQLPDHCADLIIADPPYFRTKGDFDFLLTWEEWLQMMEELAEESARILSPRGSLFLYGHALRIAYQQIIFDRFFELENNIIWEVIDAQTRKGLDGFRKFAPVTERILFYSNEKNYPDPSGWEIEKHNIENFKDLRDYFRALFEFFGKTKKELIGILGQGADHPFRFSSAQWDLPTRETYTKLEELGITSLGIYKPFEKLKKMFEAERRRLQQKVAEHESRRRRFDNYLGQTDVIRYSREGSKNFGFNHETIKPEPLSELLIRTTTAPDDLVVVPFSGSGTEAAMAARNGRRFVGFEIQAEHVKTGRLRVQEEHRTPPLFFQ